MQVFFYLISPRDMSYHGNVVLFILFMNQVTEGSGYNCSDFDDVYGKPLKECPPAKFMLKDNLVECFDYFERILDYSSKTVLSIFSDRICFWNHELYFNVVTKYKI